MAMHDVGTRGESPEADRANAGRVERGRRGRILRISGLVLIGGALALGAYIWWTLWGTGFATAAAQEEIRPEFERTIGTAAPEEAPPKVAHVPGDAVAIIRIPKIDVDYVVVEGTDVEIPQEGPGSLHRHRVPVGGDRPGRDRGASNDLRLPVLVAERAPTGRPDRARHRVRGLRVPGDGLGDHLAVGRFGPAIDRRADARPHDLQPAVLRGGAADRVRRPSGLSLEAGGPAVTDISSSDEGQMRVMVSTCPRVGTKATMGVLPRMTYPDSSAR